MRVVGACRALRRNWLLAILFSAGLSLRVLAEVAYQPALVYIDSDRYLRGQFAMDPLGYLILLRPLQRAGGLATVAAAQHMMGLGIAATIYLVLRRRGIWRWAAAVAAGPVLLDAYQLQAEESVMPDVLFETLMVAALAVLLWHREAAAWRVAVAGLLLGAAVDVRQVGEILIVPALLFTLTPGPRWRRRLVHGALVAAGFAVPVLSYMTAQFAVNGQFAITQRDTYIFYGRVAAAADCATLRLPADERPLCPSRPVVDALGIDGLVGAPSGPLISYRPPPGMTVQAMAGRFERQVLFQQPLAVASAIDRDLVKLFATTRDQEPGDIPITRWQFQLSYPSYPPLITARYVAQIKPGGRPPSVNMPIAAFLRGYQLHGGFTPGPLLALAAIAGLTGLCGLDGSGREHVALSRACLLVTSMAAAVLLVSDAYEFSWRYQLPALALLPLAGVLGVPAIAGKVRFEVAAWRALQPSAKQEAHATSAPGTITISAGNADVHIP